MIVTLPAPRSLAWPRHLPFCLALAVSACKTDPVLSDHTSTPEDSSAETDASSGESTSEPTETSSGDTETPTTIPPDTPDMVEIPAGSFMMGCNKETAPLGCDPTTLPYHKVELSAYAIDTLEVTIASYKECVAAGKCLAASADCFLDPPPNAPQACVSWFSAQAYCKFRGKRLPTEAEWERAFRGDSADLFPWGNNLPTNCEVDAMYAKRGENPHNPPWCGEAKAQPVGSRPHDRSPYGVYDMAGSVSEWVNDFYDVAYYGKSPAKDPQGPDVGGEGTATARVQRGAGYGFPPGDYVELQLTWRWHSGQNGGQGDAGFRCAKSL